MRQTTNPSSERRGKWQQEKIAALANGSNAVGRTLMGKRVEKRENSVSQMTSLGRSEVGRCVNTCCKMCQGKVGQKWGVVFQSSMTSLALNVGPKPSKPTNTPWSKNFQKKIFFCSKSRFFQDRKGGNLCIPPLAGSE